MVKKTQDKKTDIITDRHETVSAMEPLLLSDGSRHRARLHDLALELVSRASGFHRSLPESMRPAVADMVRAMNCYYSNLIEGHNTHPVDIERALNGDYSGDAEKRNLQKEARAHVAVQRWIDAGGVRAAAMTVTSLRTMHEKFCAELPEELLRLTDAQIGGAVMVVPGEFRRQDVAVGRHIAISAGAVPRFMERFESAYANLGRSETILAAAAAHHRFLWVHPFTDGNGRVARLMSHAALLDVLDTGGLWSIARGLARRAAEYKTHLANCDLQRRNDLDGRGNLSEETLAEFTAFFLETCIDQVKFMEELMQPDRLRTRILLWAEEEIRLNFMPVQAKQLLEILLYRGELPRGEVAGILNVTDRHARRIVAALDSVISSATPRSPLRLTFPAHLAARWMPGLFPEKN
jgi:Fic family protein